MGNNKQPSTPTRAEGCVTSDGRSGDFSLLPYRRLAGSALTILGQKLSLLQAFSTYGENRCLNKRPCFIVNLEEQRYIWWLVTLQKSREQGEGLDNLMEAAGFEPVSQFPKEPDLSKYLSFQDKLKVCQWTVHRIDGKTSLS